MTRRNTRRAFERFFRSDRMLAEYLTPDRLEFYERIADAAAAYRPASVVDVGCGSGELIRALARRLPARTEYAGLDYARAAIERARIAFPAAQWVAADLYRVDPEEVLGGSRFELVLCTEVLEHLRRPDSALELLVALCAPGGRVVVTVPDGAVDTWSGHENFWTEEELSRFLTPYGLREIRRIGDGDALMGVLEPRP